MSTPTCEGLRAAWVEQQAREAAKQAAAEFDGWLAAEHAKAWQEAADEISQQGTIQIPDNPYEETSCGG